jgi:V8-like Glu-specific endopeptidase
MRYQILGFFALASMLLGVRAVADESQLPPWLTERKVLGHNDLEPIESAAGTAIYAASRGIARVETVAELMAFCTATRVGVDLFITNFHCYDFKSCDQVQFHLAYEQKVAKSDQLVVRCKGILAKNHLLDYVLYQVESSGSVPHAAGLPEPEVMPSGTDQSVQAPRPPDLASFPIATLWGGPVTVGQRVFLVGYPGSRTKEVDRGAECILRTVEPQLIEGRHTITHTCDTEGGSSGSPLMDIATAYIVGLHWGGTDKFNMAIPMAEVIADLKAQLPPEVYAQLQIARAAP